MFGKKSSKSSGKWGSKSRRGRIHEAATAVFEPLEGRRLMSTVIVIGDGSVGSPVEDKAFTNNQVATVAAYTPQGQALDCSGFSAQITWGDGQVSDGTIGPKVSGDYYAIEGSHTYAEGGAYPISVDVTASDGTSAHEEVETADVADAPLAMTDWLVTATAGQETTSTVATLIDSNPDAPVSDYTARLFWGDDSSQQPDPGQVISLGGGKFEVVGTHTYAAEGTYYIQVVVQDIDGGIAQTVSTAQVSAASTTTTNTNSGQNPNSNNGSTGSGPTGTGPTGTGPTGTGPTGSGPTGNSTGGNPPQSGSAGSNNNSGGAGSNGNGPTGGSSNGNGPTGSNSGPTNGTDLSVLVNGDQVVPAKAKDLHLNEIFGTEKINVPVAVQNVGTDPARGSAVVDIYVSTSSTIDATSKLLSKKTIEVNLQPGGEQDLTVGVAVPKTLATGGRYYLVARLNTPIQETGGPGANDTGATATGFEFVGTPNYNLPVFSNGTYFRFIRDLFNGNLAITTRSGAADPSNAFSFVKAFEAEVPFPYLDNASPRQPTIGVGINLNAVGGAFMTELAGDVRSYYQSQGNNSWNSLTDAQVIAKLKAEAKPYGAVIHAPVALSSDDDDALSQERVATFAASAQTKLGAAWDNLNSYVQVAAIDLNYNVKGGLGAFPTFVSDLQAGDLLRAAFHLVDAKRTTQPGNPGLTARTEAEFQNVLMENQSDLGNLSGL